jgi:hypothetical protein
MVTSGRGEIGQAVERHIDADELCCLDFPQRCLSFLIRENSSDEASWAVWAFPVKLTPNRPTSGWPVTGAQSAVVRFAIVEANGKFGLHLGWSRLIC